MIHWYSLKFQDKPILRTGQKSAFRLSVKLYSNETVVSPDNIANQWPQWTNILPKFARLLLKQSRLPLLWTNVFVQRAVGSLQKCSLLYSTCHLELVIGRNQDWFHESKKGTLSEKHQLFRALHNESTSKARKVPLQTLNKRCRGNSAWCRTRGTARRPMKSRATQTSMTASALWCLEDCLVKIIETGSSRPPRYNCWLRRRRSWRNGFNTLIRSLTALLKSVMIPLPAYLKWSSISTLISCPPWQVQKAIKQLSPGKVPGPDAIPANVYKAGVATMMQKVKEVFQSMWNERKVPQ